MCVFLVWDGGVGGECADGGVSVFSGRGGEGCWEWEGDGEGKVGESDGAGLR